MEEKDRITYRHIDTFADFGFKKIFGEKSNKEFLHQKEGRIVALTYLKAEQLGEKKIFYFCRKASRKSLIMAVMLTIMLMGSLNGFSQNEVKQVLDSIIAENSYKYVFSYNNKGDKTLQIRYTWQNNTWVEEDKYENRYDLSYSKTDLICPSSLHSNNMQVEQKYYAWEETDWKAPVIATYYWSTNKTVKFVKE